MNEVARNVMLNLEESAQDSEGYLYGDGLCKISHYFASGVYAREMWMPAGYFITGKIHLTEHICVLSQGSVTVYDGGKTVDYQAPAIIISKVGAKRAIYAHEESVWTNFHATELTDPELIEEAIIAESFEHLDGLLARNDYERFLLEFDLTEDDVQKVTHSSAVVVVHGAKFVVRKSEIEGVGLFPIKRIEIGETIAPALLDGEKTEAGRFTNHSGKPNAEMVIAGNNINLVAIMDIDDKEITTDYRNTLMIQGRIAR